MLSCGSMICGIPRVSAWAAHAFAWAAGGFLAFGPTYRGQSVAPVEPGGPRGEATWTSQTLVEANGLGVVPLLVAPILLTGVALLAIHSTSMGQATRRVLLWSSSVMVLGFSLVAIFSIGVFYLPSGLALLVAATTGLGGRAKDA